MIELPSGEVVTDFMHDDARACPTCRATACYWTHVGIGELPDVYECHHCGHTWEEYDDDELDLNWIFEPGGASERYQPL